MDESNNQLKREEQRSIGDLHMLPCDQRYRTSNYFLEDQLRCSEAVADFRSVREFFSKTGSFSFGNPFQFQTQAVPVRVDDSSSKQRP